MADANEPLKCTRVVVKSNGEKRLDGSVIRWHETCKAPAERVTFSGHTTQAEAILCYKHRMEAEAEIAKSRNGKKAREADPRQTTIDVFQFGDEDRS
jgi:hypothetical protein